MTMFSIKKILAKIIATIISICVLDAMEMDKTKIIIENEKKSNNINKTKTQSTFTNIKTCCEKLIYENENLLNSNADISKTLETLKANVSAIKYFDKNKEKIGIEISIDSDDDKKKLLNNGDNFYIYVLDENNKEVQKKIFLKWDSKSEITNGKIKNIKNSFLVYNENHKKNKPYSFCIKVPDEFILKEKIKIKIEYKNNEKIIEIFAKFKDKEIFTLEEILADKNCSQNIIEDDNFNKAKDVLDKSKIIAECRFNEFEDTIKIKFPTNNLLFQIREKLKIKVYDSNNAEIDGVFLTWKTRDPIFNDENLINIKHGFLKEFCNNDPYSFSMKINEHFIDNTIKIKIYIDEENSFWYVKNKEDEELINICKHKDNKKMNEKLRNKIEDNKVKIQEINNIFKNPEKIKYETINKFYNGIKLIFPKNEKLLDDDVRKLFKIKIEDEKGDKIEDETVFYKWGKNTEQIKNDMSLIEIKKGLFARNLYPNNDPYSLSLKINEKFHGRKVKIKIYIDEKTYWFVKDKNNNELVAIE